MKKTIIGNILILALGALTAQMSSAQGAITFLSNLAQSSTGSTTVGSDSWQAALFNTGGNPGGYALDSVQLSMADDSGDPSGFTVMLYSGANIHGGTFPGSSLGTLTGSVNPSTAGVYTYTAPSGLTLSPGSYFIVITAGTAVANGTYEWSDTGAISYNPTGGWNTQGGVLTSDNGSSWNQVTVVPQFAINATPAPEPGVIGFFALGGLLVAFQRRKARPVQ